MISASRSPYRATKRSRNLSREASILESKGWKDSISALRPPVTRCGVAAVEAAVVDRDEPWPAEMYSAPDPPLVSGRKVGLTASLATSRPRTESGARLSTEG